MLIRFTPINNTRGNEGKENALQWLDKIAYARLETDYNAHLNELHMYNDSLATWIEKNEPQHWAMSKFLEETMRQNDNKPCRVF